MVEDQCQARTGRSRMLKPGTFGAMTTMLDVSTRRRREPCGYKGLTGHRRHRYRQDGKSGRNSTFAPERPVVVGRGSVRHDLREVDLVSSISTTAPGSGFGQVYLHTGSDSALNKGVALDYSLCYNASQPNRKHACKMHATTSRRFAIYEIRPPDHYRCTKGTFYWSNCGRWSNEENCVNEY